jgi:hypothetical protein
MSGAETGVEFLVWVCILHHYSTEDFFKLFSLYIFLHWRNSRPSQSGAYTYLRTATVIAGSANDQYGGDVAGGGGR